ncbi:MAG: NifB/NifX family molybdenum-iron cluster-binding protein [Candidatus Eisenbacteria bacterium]|nr:NifB/NifX family molybdenum-iron cluster-binding protein [Candidatus Eisenbacteria bacterium]
MKLCFPVLEDRGLEGIPHEHFGTAPYFFLCDTESEETSLIDNRGAHQAHGGCAPVDTLQQASVEAVIVGGIGPRAVARFQAAGVRVFRAVPGTIGDHVDLVRENRLPEWGSSDSCGGGEHGCE